MAVSLVLAGWIYCYATPPLNSRHVRMEVTKQESCSTAAAWPLGVLVNYKQDSVGDAGKVIGFLGQM